MLTFAEWSTTYVYKFKAIGLHSKELSKDARLRSIFLEPAKEDFRRLVQNLTAL